MESEGLLKFKGNEALSDISLTKEAKPDVDPIRGHKVVLAACSGLFHDLFTKEDQELVDEFKIPAPVSTKTGMTEDPYNQMFVYAYCDQTFAKIKEELSPNNVFQLYSVAYTLKIKQLQADLETFIINELLDSENCINFYLDAIRFDSERITEACEKLLVQEFQEVCTSKDGHYFLSQLPLKYFKSLMKRDELNVENESLVLECVERYIRHRAEVSPDKTEEEKKREREEREKAGEEAQPDPEEEEKKKREEEYNALDDKGKIQWRYSDEVEKLRKEADERMRVKGLRSEDKRKLFKTIRFAFLTHQELLKCSRDPLFNEAKEFLVEGLTYQIEPEEVIGKEETVISLVPRHYYTQQDHAYQEPHNLPNVGPQNTRAPQQHRLNEKGIPNLETGQQPRRGQDKWKNQTDNMQQPYVRSQTSPVRKGRGLANKSPIRPGYGQQTVPTQPPHHQTSPVRGGPWGQQNMQGRPMSGYQSDNQYPRTGGAMGERSPQLSYPPRNVVGGMDDTFARADQPHYDPHTAPAMPPMKFGVPGQKSKRHGPQPSWTQKQPQVSSFDYSFDFDENGALYYLGTNGGTKIWQNPHTIGQVQAFASSIGFGQVQDLVGRKCVNLRTLNEPFSFFGIDFGEGRKIRPTCYTIMNRNSSTHVLMNWHFEGSNDKLNWTILDRRVYMPDQMETGGFQQEYVDEELLESLCQKQGTNTWGIDQNVYQDITDEGFRFFRIIQISPNSSGSDNLALSCVEIYGQIVSGRFP